MYQRLVTILATGYILLFFSEIIFWVDYEHLINSSPNLIVLWALYSLGGFAMLSLVRYFKVQNWWSLFLVGALFGWIVEGIFAKTMYVYFPFRVI